MLAHLILIKLFVTINFFWIKVWLYYNLVLKFVCVLANALSGIPRKIWMIYILSDSQNNVIRDKYNYICPCLAILQQILSHESLNCNLCCPLKSERQSAVDSK